MRIRVYLRGSKDEIKIENQIPDVEDLVKRRGWQIEQVYAEHKSAAKRRPEFERMLADATARKFDVLIVWRLDRFGRSLAGNLDDVRRLDRAGVTIVSCKEGWLDTTEGAFRHLLIAIFSYVAQAERETLIERTKAGMARARSEGIRIGRPPASRLKVAEALRLVASGTAVRQAATVAGVGEGTVRRAIKGLATTAPPDAP